MTYVLPQVLVYQEFDRLPQVTIQPLNAFIFGGHAFLSRYSVADEKAAAYLGVYDYDGTLIDGEYKQCYSWPGKPTGSIIDLTYTKVYIDNALLRYYRNTAGTASVSGNTLTLSGTNFKANPADPTTYPRAGAFYDRDVAVGDIVSISGDNGSGGATKTLSTYVKGITAATVASSAGTPSAAAANQAATTEAATTSAGASNSGDATVASSSAAAYNGLADGVVSEVYTVLVTQSSTGGVASTARLRITSASGLDDVLDFQPNANVFADTATGPTAMPVGTRGGTITFTATDDGSDPTSEFTAGDTWTVTFTQDYEVPTVASTGTGTDYSGTTDTTYIVEVTTGGAYGTAKVTVTTVDGSDYSGPTTVPTTPATDFAIGTKGVVINFSDTTDDTLVLGDRWYITATAATSGNYNTLVLGHNMPAGLSASIEFSLYIRKDIELDDKHASVAGQYNWKQSDTELCVYAGIQAYDSTWTNSGTPLALDVVTDPVVANSNKLYAEYRAWRSDLSVTPLSISDVSELADVPGALHPDNLLKWALYKALSNNNGQPVQYMAVANPSLSASWIDVLEAIEERENVYGLVPLTTDSTFLGLCQAHVQAQSTELMGRWRTLWVSLTNSSVVSVVTTDADGDAAVATTEDDSATSGTQYTILKSTGATFEDAGVRAGDVVRYLYTTDAFGEVSYTEFVVDAVVNQETIRLTTGTTVAESVARKFEIWRNLTVAEQATAIALTAGNYADRRVRAVWPDTVSSDGYTTSGYFLCAALAALSGGVSPHQGLTRLEIIGFDAVPRTTELFSRTQLDQLAASGVWIVTQHPQTGEIYTRHALTTADYVDINAREEMIVRNVDSISYYFMSKFAPYIGIANVTPSTVDKIGAETRAAIEYLRSANFTQLLGGQLIDATISELRQSPVFSDRIILALDLEIPYALNTLEIHLVV